MSYDIYTGMLKMFPDFEPSNFKVALSYKFTCMNLKKLSDDYRLIEIAGTVSDFEKAKNLLIWLSAHTLHKGDYDNHVTSLALDLLEYTFDKGMDGAVNSLAIILTSLLLAVGIPARTVYIMPFSPYDGDNHVVTHAYIKEQRKWIMLDPTYSSYISNEKVMC
ncbi:MAG: transglutaminase domain-containing protein [Eubacteriales bacterium]